MLKALRNLNRRNVPLLVSVDAFADAIRATGASPLTYLPYSPRKPAMINEKYGKPNNLGAEGVKEVPYY